MLAREGRLPDTLVACIGGGSNAMGLFHPFLDDPTVRMHRRRGRRATGSTSGWSMPPRLTGGRPGVLHGNRTYLLQDADGQIIEGHSISAGLDYPGIGPEHAWLHDVGPGRVRRASPTPRRSRPSSCVARPRESSPRSSRRTPSAHVIKLAPTLPARPPAGDEHVRTRRQGHLHRRRGARNRDRGLNFRWMPPNPGLIPGPRPPNPRAERARDKPPADGRAAASGLFSAAPVPSGRRHRQGERHAGGRCDRDRPFARGRDRGLRPARDRHASVVAGAAGVRGLRSRPRERTAEGRGPSRRDRARAHLRRRDRQAAQGRGRPARRPRRRPRGRPGRRPGRCPGRRAGRRPERHRNDDRDDHGGRGRGGDGHDRDDDDRADDRGDRGGSGRGGPGRGATTMARTTTTTETRPRGTGRSARGVAGLPVVRDGVTGLSGEAAAGSGRCDDDR